VLPVHCFRSLHGRGYFDEHSNSLPGEMPPVGDYAVDSYRTIDDRISDALGVARAPD
jgi:hypothetical protein